MTVPLESVRRAAEQIRGAAVRTPVLDASHWAGGPLGLKLENLQPTGAFKVRGATVALARLSPAARARGVVTHSSGNHAQALAFAARAVGVPATIVIPHGAPQGKVRATSALGARVVRVDPGDRVAAADAVVAETGGVLVPPYDHPDVIAGQGTVGLEILQDAADVQVVLVPVSGGGLISGIAVALASHGVRVVGVEPALAADAAESLRTGRRVAWPAGEVQRTVADGLRVSQLGELAWEHVRRFVDRIVTVSEDEIADAARALAVHARVVAEPSGAVTTAAWLHHRSALPPGRTVAVVSGGNVDPGWLAGVLRGQDDEPHRLAPPGAIEQDEPVIEVRPGGRRRIDRVLAAGFAEGLAALPLAEVRARRDEAAQEETDLSYLRRLLHARIDIVRAEQRRRSAGSSAPIVADLARILSSNAVAPATGSGRHQTVVPSVAEAHRRHVEALVSDVDLSDVGSLSAEQLEDALGAYCAEEESVSQRRRQVQQVMDRLNAEIGSRYAGGAASVDDLLADEGR